jgi:Holliday junction resolvase RusA-like endonuclease
MKIILNLLPPTINKYIGRDNKFQYHKEKKQIEQAIRLQTIGYNPRITKCKMKVIYYFKDRRKHDPGNYDKVLLDGLVEANIIEDDNYSVITEYTTIGKVDKGNPRTEIEIEVLDE